MATTDATATPATDAAALAERCRDAEFLTIYAAATGDGLAAAATIAAARAALDRPYQVALVRTPAARRDRRAAADEAATPLELDNDREAGRLAYEIAERLGLDPDPVPALAGLVAGGRSATDAPLLVEAAGLERRPGLAIPTSDPLDGLVHTTLAHGPFSGDHRAAETLIDDIDGDPLELASALVLSVAGHGSATERSAVAVERAVRPHALDGPIPTLGGLADVLSALARTAPGLGLALLQTGHGVEDALDIWRTRALAAHEAVRGASPERFDGLVIAGTDGPVEPIARLLRDFRAPESTVLSVGGEEAAIAGLDDSVGQVLVDAADTVGGSARDHGRRGYATYPAGTADDLVDAVREAE